MGRKKKSMEQQIQEAVTELQQEFDHWEEEYENSCRDPFWSDGINLNLVRNHIIYSKHKLDKLCREAGVPLPELYGRETPPEVSPYYYAHREEITAKGEALLKWAESTYDLDGYQADSPLLHTYHGLKDDLKSGVLARIRWRSEDTFIQAAERSEKKAGGYEVTTEGQLSLSPPAKKQPKPKPERQNNAADQSEQLLPVYHRYSNTWRRNTPSGIRSFCWTGR